MNAPLHKQMPRAAPDDGRALQHANAQMMVSGAVLANTRVAGRAIP